MKIEKDGPYTGPVLLRQGEPGTSQYITKESRIARGLTNSQTTRNEKFTVSPLAGNKHRHFIFEVKMSECGIFLCFCHATYFQ